MTSTITLPYEVIAEDTTKLPRPEWLALRLQGLGSSDAAAVMELSPWKSSYAVHAEKAGLYDPEDESKRDFYDWRLALEPVILDHAERQDDIGPMQRNLMIRSRQYPHMLANPDGLTPTRVIEAKTAHSMDEKRWENGIPDQYSFQAIHLMIVADRRECVFPVMFGCSEPRYFIVRWDQKVADLLIDREAEFWANVLAGNPPDPDGSDDAMQAIRAIYLAEEEGKELELPADAKELIEARNVNNARKKDAEKEIERVRQILMIAADDAQVLTLDGIKVATYKTNKAGNRTFRFSENGSAA
jgi:putative phage-type endonuclease